MPRPAHALHGMRRRASPRGKLSHHCVQHLPGTPLHPIGPLVQLLARGKRPTPGGDSPGEARSGRLPRHAASLVARRVKEKHTQTKTNRFASG